MEHLFKLETILKVGAILLGIIIWWFAFSTRLDSFVGQTNLSLNTIERQHKDMLPILRQICRNTARTEAAQGSCDRIEQ